MKERIQIEDALKRLHEREYQGKTTGPEALAGLLGCGLDESSERLAKLEAGKLAQQTEGRYRLTAAGRDYARQVIRAHRLYETYLAQKTGLKEAEWHRKAEEKEHVLTAAETSRMAERLGHPRYDPHGDPIPSAKGELPPIHGQVLADCEPDWKGRIVHIEDEPSSFYQRLVDEGFAPGMPIHLLHRDEERLRLNVEGRIIELPLAIARSLRVLVLQSGDAFESHTCRLTDLQFDETATVRGLSPACRGAERNRLLDLGIVPGTPIKKALSSAAGSPNAYRIRNALIALRREQTDRVLINKNLSESE